MKSTIILISFIAGITWPVYSQAPTYYGLNAGTAGNYGSFFGQEAGKGLSYYDQDNTAIGYKAFSESNEGGSSNTAVGAHSLAAGGYRCTAVGNGALKYNNSETGNEGQENVAIGVSTLGFNKGGDYNTAVGSYAMQKNNGNYNTGFGYQALTCVQAFLTGSYNTGMGASTLPHNTTGQRNSAHGYQSLYQNTTGNNNTANGYNSLYSNTTGGTNVAVGSQAMLYNLMGNYNTAVGPSALQKNNMGSYNTAGGYRALDGNTTGSYNTSQGVYALFNVVSGNYNSALGYNAGPSTTNHLDNTTALGYLAVPTASNQVRIGNTSVTSIGGQVEWTAFSDGRFKKDIKEDISGLDFINELRPVSYTVDNAGLNKFLHVNDSSSNQAEAKSIPVRQTGFVAQEVEALVKKTGYVFSGVDAPENEKDPYGIRYAAFVVPLVKAVQELSAEVQEQREQIQLLLTQLDSKTEINSDVNSQAALLQNTPNPFDAESEIKMTLPDNVVTATVMIYNLEGKQMKNIHVANRGDVTIKISGSELSAGMYLYSLIVDGKVMDTKRMVLTR